MVNVFLFCDPPGGQRWADATARCMRVNCAHQINALVDVRYPDVERIVLVMDNLNTHSPTPSYEAIPSAEARWNEVPAVIAQVNRKHAAARR